MYSCATSVGKRVSQRLSQYHYQQWKLLNALPFQEPIAHKSPCPSCSSTTRSYISRAHPKPRPIFAISQAIDEIVQDVEKRREKRQARWEKWDRNKDGKLKHPDESVELVLGLNLDPRKPGQSLRGNITLPHGSGKKLSCIAFSNDETVIQSALERGATHAGGGDLITSIAEGSIALDTIDRSLATMDVMPEITKKLARILGPRGLMPNSKTKSLMETGEDLLKALGTQLAGQEVVYRTGPHGDVMVLVGKISFGKTKLLENIGRVVEELYAMKPEQYGKGKMNKKGPTKAPYMLRAYLASTQGIGCKLDITTLDPNSAFYLADPTTLQ